MTPRSPRFDAIVVGARCAGAPTAMLLARQGHRVLLLDRGDLPSDTLSTHNLVQPGLAFLAAWGLLDELLATGCPAATATRVTMGTTTFEVPIQPVAGIAVTCAPRRTVLDAMLLDAARGAGAEVRLQHSVRGLLRRDGNVVGVTGRGADGREFRAEAPVVIGADGVRSLVARAVGARTYREGPDDNCAHYAYWTGLPDPHLIDVAMAPGRVLAIFPTHDDAACVVSARPAAEWERYRQEPEAEFLASLALVPAVQERVLAGRRTSSFKGAPRLPNHFREAVGPGWALVGDAGLVKDPGPGRGMSDAFRQAARLADEVDAGLRSGGSMVDALERYARWRDATFGPVFDTTVELARYDPTLDEVPMRFLRHQTAIDADHQSLDDELRAHQSSRGRTRTSASS